MDRKIIINFKIYIKKIHDLNKNKDFFLNSRHLKYVDKIYFFNLNFIFLLMHLLIILMKIFFLKLQTRFSKQQSIIILKVIFAS
jgi:hypothetical protein